MRTNDMDLLWASPEIGLWVASAHRGSGVVHCGVIEEHPDGFHVIDDRGGRVSIEGTLAEAMDALSRTDARREELSAVPA